MQLQLCFVYLFSFPKQIIKRKFIHRSHTAPLSHFAYVKLNFKEKEKGTSYMQTADGISHLNLSGVPRLQLRVQPENVFEFEYCIQGHPELYHDFKANLDQRLSQTQTNDKTVSSNAPPPTTV